MSINQGTRLSSICPEEASFRTSFDFDVMNHDNKWLVTHKPTWKRYGHNTFNDMFTKNRSTNVSMIFDAESGLGSSIRKEATPNFGGTVKKVLDDPNYKN